MGSLAFKDKGVRWMVSTFQNEINDTFEPPGTNRILFDNDFPLWCVVANFFYAFMLE